MLSVLKRPISSLAALYLTHVLLCIAAKPTASRKSRHSEGINCVKICSGDSSWEGTGNWKSNGTLASTKELVERVLNPTEINYTSVNVVVSPSALHLNYVRKMIRPETKWLLRTSV